METIMTCHSCGKPIADGEGERYLCMGINEISASVKHKECPRTNCSLLYLIGKDIKERNESKTDR